MRQLTFLILGLVLGTAGVALATSWWDMDTTPPSQKDTSQLNPQPVSGGYRNLTATILDSATESDEQDLKGAALIGVDVGSDIEGTSLKYKCAATSGGSFHAIQDEAGVDCENTTQLSRFTSPEAGTCSLAVSACRYLKLVMGSAQSGDGTITLVVK